MMLVSQKRAKAGGEVGVNGDFYEGGKFLPSTERAKGKRVKPKARKVQVAPGEWVTDDTGRRAIFSLVGGPADYADRRAGDYRMVPFLPAFAGRGTVDGLSLAETAALCDRYNAGERWMEGGGR